MTVDIGFLDQRVEKSLDFLRSHFDNVLGHSQEPLYVAAVQALRINALGGKHLRSRLVHIGAGDVAGEQLQAAIVFGGAVDLLHSSLLIHDDIIDDDPYRRSVRTIHSQVAESSGDTHVGTSAGILAGDMGLMATFQALSSSQLSAELVSQACAMMSSYSVQTVFGELLDVSHLVNHDTTMDTVRESNYLKTSIYSFLAPLHLGALAAGENTAQRVQALQAVADPLGRAYQAVDDVAGAIAPMEVTGKVEGGDIHAGRTTLLTIRLERMDLDSAVAEVKHEAAQYLDQARSAVKSPELSPVTQAGVADIIARIERSLHEL